MLGERSDQRGLWEADRLYLTGLLDAIQAGDVLEIWPESGGSRASGYTWGQQA